jgi:hypothetical protein
MKPICGGKAIGILVCSFVEICSETRRLGSNMEDGRQKPEDPKSRLTTIRIAMREFFYGMTVHDLAVETRHARGELDHLFMLVVFGDLIGLPILPPYYSMRLLPYVMPSIQRWKRSALREKDLTDLARVDI